MSSIKWHPYPEEKPRYEEDYSIYLIDEADIGGAVIAWAEEA